MLLGSRSKVSIGWLRMFGIGTGGLGGHFSIRCFFITTVKPAPKWQLAVCKQQWWPDLLVRVPQVTAQGHNAEEADQRVGLPLSSTSSDRSQFLSPLWLVEP